MIKIIIDERVRKFFLNPWLHSALLLFAIAFLVYRMMAVEVVKVEIPDEIFYQQRNIYILDAGHGYSAGNKCNHKSLQLKDSCFYEYKFNIRVVEKLANLLDERGVFYLRTDTLSHKQDMPVMDRVSFVNRIYDLGQEKGVPPVIFSIHANASSNKKARGLEIFANIEKCEKYFENKDFCVLNMEKGADLLLERLKLEIPYQEYRIPKNKSYKNSSRAHEGDIAILKSTKAYSYLLECGFFTNDEDRKLLSSDEYQTKIALAIFKTICSIEGISTFK